MKCVSVALATHLTFLLNILLTIVSKVMKAVSYYLHEDQPNCLSASGMVHVLVDLDKVNSDYNPWVKIGLF